MGASLAPVSVEYRAAQVTGLTPGARYSAQPVNGWPVRYAFAADREAADGVAWQVCQAWRHFEWIEDADAPLFVRALSRPAELAIRQLAPPPPDG